MEEKDYGRVYTVIYGIAIALLVAVICFTYFTLCVSDYSVSFSPYIFSLIAAAINVVFYLVVGILNRERALSFNLSYFLSVLLVFVMTFLVYGRRFENENTYYAHAFRVVSLVLSAENALLVLLFLFKEMKRFLKSDK